MEEWTLIFLLLGIFFFPIVSAGMALVVWMYKVDSGRRRRMT